MKEKKRIVEKTERAKKIAPYICAFSIAPNSDVGSQMSSQMFFILAISLGVSFYRTNLTVFFFHSIASFNLNETIFPVMRLNIPLRYTSKAPSYKFFFSMCIYTNSSCELYYLWYIGLQMYRLDDTTNCYAPEVTTVDLVLTI